LPRKNKRLQSQTLRFLAFGIILPAIILLTSGDGDSAVRIKDLATFEGMKTEPIIGYGLVVGLNGTGDGNRSVFTAQAFRNMMERFGVSLDADRIKVKNVAAVMVTAELVPGIQEGSRIDVTVSSMGDASSLEGGTLLLTPLTSADGATRAQAQGSISIGGFQAAAGGNQIRQGHPVVGRIPEGASVVSPMAANGSPSDTIRIHLNAPDFTTAVRLTEAVNNAFNGTAVVIDRGTVQVNMPEDRHAKGIPSFLAELEAIELEPDGTAKVVINERTGTVVVGEKVTLSSAAVSHGNLTVEITSTPQVSQPAPFSGGKTVVAPQDKIQVGVGHGPMTVIEKSANVGEVAKTLNSLGVTPRDLIAIFQALKEAGALNAELVII
jgi:flagellar P-ring protein precursor FlgI